MLKSVTSDSVGGDAIDRVAFPANIRLDFWCFAQP